MTPLVYLAAWSRARRSASSPYLGIDRVPMSNIECARYRRVLRAQGVEPGDLFKIRDP